ncbi:MAG: 50S ribosomal protein L2 [Candidatus Hydrothermarchaeaceae archaeon]
MGKRITVQRRGKGTSVYRSRSHKHKGDVTYRAEDAKEIAVGKVVDIIHAPGRSSPLARVLFEDGKSQLMLAMEGMKVGDEIQHGTEAEVKPGNVLPLSKIPEGTYIYNIENKPGDGGKFVRATGTFALLISHDADSAVVKLPSGKLKSINSRCRATIGVVSGGGRKDKPIFKAGKMWHILKPKAKYWPIVRKVRMNPVAHPHGGGSGHPGKPTSVSRNAPPGRKVGLIAARRGGKR